MQVKTKISDRELFKILKRHKAFSNFYLACAQAWCDSQYNKPRTNLRGYIDGTAKKRILDKDADEYIDAIKNNWLHHNKEIKLI